MYYKVIIQIPLILEPEITQLFFDCGAIMIDTKKQKQSVTLTAHTHNVKPFYTQFDKELLIVEKYTPTKAAEKKIAYHYDKKQPPLSLICHDAFGDGNHPTTQMCIKLLRSTLKKHSPQSLCDIGTGTGILSLIAYKQGIRNILALDYDAKSIARTKQNMRNNNARFTVQHRDIIKQKVARNFDLIIANMNSAILEQAWANILTALSKTGTLILSGIGTQWVADIKRIVLTADFIIETEQTKGDWWACVCIRKIKA